MKVSNLRREEQELFRSTTSQRAQPCLLYLIGRMKWLGGQTLLLILPNKQKGTFPVRDLLNAVGMDAMENSMNQSNFLNASMQGA